VTGDLNLGVPISSPACDSTWVVFLGAAVDAVTHQADVSTLLNSHSGAQYLLTEGGCSSMRQRTPEGSLIYAVYIVPYPRPGDRLFGPCRGRRQRLRQADGQRDAGRAAVGVLSARRIHAGVFRMPDGPVSRRPAGMSRRAFMRGCSAAVPAVPLATVLGDVAAPHFDVGRRECPSAAGTGQEISCLVICGE
jgi:hypothetical protein